MGKLEFFGILGEKMGIRELTGNGKGRNFGRYGFAVGLEGMGIMMDFRMKRWGFGRRLMRKWK